MKLPFWLLLLLPALGLQAQADTSNVYKINLVPGKIKRPYELTDPTPFMETIKASDLKSLLDVLASKEMQGRETGEPGQRKAADFIAQQFKDAGIPPQGDRNTYFQKIVLANESWSNLSLKVEGVEFKNKVDFYVLPAYNPNTPEMNLKEIVFVGYGIEDPKYNDYAKADVKGKAVLFYDGEPLNDDGKSKITGEMYRSDWALNWQKKVKLAKEKGATLVFILDPKISDNLKSKRRAIGAGGWKPVAEGGEKKASEYINNLFVSPALAQALLGDKAGKVLETVAVSGTESFKPSKVKTKIELKMAKESTTLVGSNVLAVIEGIDPQLKKEYVFVTAHYDHLGSPDSTVVYYGADDNASGSSGVIEIARAFQEARKQGVGPKRTVVCMLVSGEEKGLLGSKYYTEFPMFPLDKTIVDVNIDMIGRVDEPHKNNPNYVYVIGSDRLSPELHQINERVNTEYTKMELNYKYNAKDDPNHYYERSDHYNFAEKGIPAIFYFNGTHADYHRPTDTPDKINFDALAKRAQLAFLTAWEVADRPSRLSIEKK
ncbi:MAG: M28 family peptidase [Bacteroidetes bacterium]|nr:M28 family peptidase [Bacteroidota bacterium]